MANLTNNSAQQFKTQITEEQDPTVTIDASSFTEAVYRIFELDCTTVLVEAKLSLSEIEVIADVDSEGNPINVFLTTLTEVKMSDSIVPEGQYIHQFKVTNAAGLNLPSVFQNTVSIVRDCN